MFTMFFISLFSVCKSCRLFEQTSLNSHLLVLCSTKRRTTEARRQLSFSFSSVEGAARLTCVYQVYWIYLKQNPDADEKRGKTHIGVLPRHIDHDLAFQTTETPSSWSWIFLRRRPETCWQGRRSRWPTEQGLTSGLRNVSRRQARHDNVPTF